MLATLAQPTLQHPRDAFQSLSGLLDAIQPRLNSAEAKKEVDDVEAWVHRDAIVFDTGVVFNDAVTVDSIIGRLSETL